MNKSEELEAMVLRAEIEADETIKQHQIAWYGQEPVIVEGSKAQTRDSGEIKCQPPNKNTNE